jgi:prepilin-type N-terminal cleavage/methylation domain-containing protein
MERRERLPARGRRGFTLIELMVIIAILAAMTGVGVMSIRGGQSAARVKGATRDIFAAIRHARSQALVTQKPVVVTYSTEEPDGADGEPVAKVEIAADALLAAPVDKSQVQKLTGPSRGSAASSRNRKTASAAAEAGAAAGESILQEVLFEPIREDVVRGMRLKVVKDEDEEDEDGGEGVRKSRVSVYSNVDYYLKKYNKAKAAKTEGEAKTGAEAGAADAKSAAKSLAKGARGAPVVERQEPVSVIWEANGRVEGHRVWVYPDGRRPEDGLLIRIDRFGAAKVLSGDEREEDD